VLELRGGAQVSLLEGQVVRIAGSLWRVDYVNQCRARLVPLSRRNAERDLNVSPNSALEVVTDLARASEELELAEAEREVAELQAELRRRERDEGELAEAEREVEALRREASAMAPRTTGRGATWSPAGPAPQADPASLKAWTYWAVHNKPGQTTQQLLELVRVVRGLEGTTGGALAACLDRLWKSGSVEKS
jgi:hypothetical protein